MRTPPRGTTADIASPRPTDRRTLLTGAAGALLAATLVRPSRTSARATAQPATPASPASSEFDPALATRLQQALEDAIAAANGTVPGAILHVAHDGQDWAGAAGLAQVEPDTAMRPDDRFAIGSIVKPFVSTTVLQLVEEDAFTLDTLLPDLLPTEITDRFPSASKITLRMLLGHRSGLPDWDTPETDAAVGRDPGKIWKATEFLDLAAALEPTFAPGTSYAYSNTNYTLLGLVIEQATGRSWRDEVTNRVITPLGLASTALPAPGDRSLGGPHAHGYVEANGELIDVTTTDPSMAGPAGGNSLISSTGDLIRFLDGLLAGELFQRPQTLEAMLDFQPAEGEPGQVGYGLGLLRRAFPGGAQTIDHLGGAVGYRSYVARIDSPPLTMAMAMNSLADPSPFIIPMVELLAG